MELKIGNQIINKLADNAELLGVGAGVFAGSTSGITDIMSIIDEIMLGHIHAPNWNQMITVFKPFLTQAAYTYIAGLVLEELDLAGTKKIGTTLKKAAMAYGTTSFGIHLAYYSTHACEGCDPVKQMQGQNSVTQNFLAAPTAPGYSY